MSRYQTNLQRQQFQLASLVNQLQEVESKLEEIVGVEIDNLANYHCFDTPMNPLIAKVVGFFLRRDLPRPIPPEA